ncbi:penicillin-binding transpeptidase domain-containing protein [Weissella viridescens]|uniref:penicillin-binding transpeptidase domain-containing protein n=1 Tax=Weissella viridescens TaxID=1629 RepID=UPI0022E95946|nr:penicillin-binding transpeptidase domain-containing protein [Weissella viridescens]
MAQKKRHGIWKQLDKNSRIAGLVLLASTMLVLLVLGYRYAHIAVTKDVKGHRLDKATQQIYQSQSIDEAKRGQIFDVNGNPMAENTTSYTVVAVLDKSQIGPNGKKMYVTPSQDKHVSAVLAKELGGKASTYEKALKDGRKAKRDQVQFGSSGSQLDVLKYKQLKNKRIPGLTFVGSPARFYPNGVAAANLIGLAGNVENKQSGLTELKGNSGIEAGWNKNLTGKNGIKATAVDENDANRAKSKPAVNGSDVYTTIDSKLQAQLETRMDVLNDTMAPKSALAVVMDTQNGDIVASTQRPNYNATTGQGIGDYWQNELTNSFEPGSVMKGVTVASAIDTNNWNPNATYRSGTLNVDGKKVTDWNNGRGWGQISYDQGVGLSSNVAMALTEQRMGAKTWQRYIRNFGFLKSTKSGLPQENLGMMQFRYPFEQANTSFGQAIATTPLQMLQAYTAIAGDGTMLKPHVVSKIINPNTQKVVYEAKRQKVGQPIKAKTAAATRKQLEAVVYNDDGLGHDYALKGVRTTGKSGTAQVSTASGYQNAQNPTQEIHSWIGMAPADKPRYMMYIVVKKPQKVPSQVTKQMAGVFKPVMTQALQMAKGDNKAVSSQAQLTQVPDVKNQSRKQAVDKIEQAHLEALVMGDGDKVIAQSPAGKTGMLNKQRVFVNTGKNIVVPDMHGWSKNDVMIWADLAKIKINSKGNGFVAAQSVEGGTRLNEGVHEMTIEFKEPKVE